MAPRELHKTDPAAKWPNTLLQPGNRKRSKKNPVLNVVAGEDVIDGASITYQLELVKCGKPRCRKWHGPYWYAYWTIGARTRTLYIGKERRRAVDVRDALTQRRLERAEKPSKATRGGAGSASASKRRP